MAKSKKTERENCIEKQQKLRDKTELEKLDVNIRQLREVADQALKRPKDEKAYQTVQICVDNLLDVVGKDKRTAEAANWALLAMWNLLAPDANAAMYDRYVGRRPSWEKATSEELIAALDEAHAKHPDEKRITELRIMVADKYKYSPYASRKERAAAIKKKTDRYNPLK